jgi:2-methylisocitrate lyase-like PEP mutase family enzyme
VTADRFAEFRALHHATEPLLFPNAWDYASAAALADAGFAAVGTTSLGVAAAAGKPDTEAATLQETLALARSITGLPCPVSVDVEAGFGGGPAQVADLAEQLAELGVAGVNIEDGRPDGTLADLMAQRELISAVKARVPHLFVNARTDAFWLGTPEPLTEALTRTAAFADAGADGVFVPGTAADADIAAITAKIGVPLNVLFMPGRQHTGGTCGAQRPAHQHGLTAVPGGTPRHRPHRPRRPGRCSGHGRPAHLRRGRGADRTRSAGWQVGEVQDISFEHGSRLSAQPGRYPRVQRKTATTRPIRHFR